MTKIIIKKDIGIRSYTARNYHPNQKPVERLKSFKCGEEYEALHKEEFHGHNEWRIRTESDTGKVDEFDIPIEFVRIIED